MSTRGNMTQVTINIEIGSAHHVQVTRRVEIAARKRIKPTWNYQGVDMEIVGAHRCGNTDYLAIKLESLKG